MKLRTTDDLWEMRRGAYGGMAQDLVTMALELAETAQQKHIIEGLDSETVARWIVAGFRERVDQMMEWDYCLEGNTTGCDVCDAYSISECRGGATAHRNAKCSCFKNALQCRFGHRDTFKHREDRCRVTAPGCWICAAKDRGDTPRLERVRETRFSWWEDSRRGEHELRELFRPLRESDDDEDLS